MPEITLFCEDSFHEKFIGALLRRFANDYEARGRIRLTSPCGHWVKEALATPGLTLLALTPEIALDSSRLPAPFHGDPADRIIVATPRATGARLRSEEAKLIDYGRRRH